MTIRPAAAAISAIKAAGLIGSHEYPEEGEHMSQDAIHEFGRLVVKHVRDEAIRELDLHLGSKLRTPMALRWRELLTDDASVAVARAIIPDCVDSALFCLMDAIDYGQLKLSISTESGETVDLVDQGMGELGGWYTGSEGWLAQFSEERFVDDFADYAE